MFDKLQFVAAYDKLKLIDIKLTHFHYPDSLELPRVPLKVLVASPQIPFDSLHQSLLAAMTRGHMENDRPTS